MRQCCRLCRYREGEDLKAKNGRKACEGVKKGGLPVSLPLSLPPSLPLPPLPPSLPPSLAETWWGGAGVVLVRGMTMEVDTVVNSVACCSWYAKGVRRREGGREGGKGGGPASSA